MRTLLAAAAFAIAAFGAAAPAHAWTDEAAPVKIRHADLDLATQADAKIMMSRIGRAANTMCRTPEFMQGYSERAACKRDIAEQAVAALNAPMLTAMMIEKYGPMPDTTLAAAEPTTTVQ